GERGRAAAVCHGRHRQVGDHHAGGGAGADAAGGRLPDERGQLRAGEAGGEGAAHRPGQPDRGGPRGPRVRAGRRYAARARGGHPAAPGRAVGGAPADDRRLRAGARPAGRARCVAAGGGLGGGVAGGL
ncbi:MAG: Lipid-A-disaccharide synthase, partial [uncultured Gemmatimonadetes bacterium]